MDHPAAVAYPYWQGMEPALPVADNGALKAQQESYFERLLRVKSQASQQQQSSNGPIMPFNTAPASTYTSQPSAASMPQPPQRTPYQYNMAPNARAAPFPKVEITPSTPSPSINNNNVNPAAPVSRFQQLLHMKMAAERSSTPAGPSNAQVPAQLTQAFARLQEETTDTVLNKDFASRHYTNDGSEQPIHSKGNPPNQQYMQQSYAYVPQTQQNSYAPPTNSGYDPRGTTGQCYPSTTAPAQNPAHSGYSGQRDLNQAAPVTNHILNVYAPNYNLYNSSPIAQSPAELSNQNLSSYYSGPSSSASASPMPIAQMKSASVPYQSQMDPTRNQGQSTHPWNTIPESCPPPSDWSRPLPPPVASYSAPTSRSTPSFSWSVSEVRTPTVEIPYQPRQSAQHPPTPLSYAPTSTTPPSAVSPIGQRPFDGTSHIPAAYTQIKTEPDTTPPRLNANYGRPSPHAFSASPSASSPLLNYGIAMFANMNGSVQLPGQALYTSSNNGLNGDLPQTLADGLAGGSGGGGQSGGSNGSGNEWTNGSGNGDEGGDNGEAGQGNGHGSGGGSGDDGNDGSGDGNTPKGKKLALACHFCRRRKLKCNGERPKCDNCTKRNEECSWDDNVRRRGPGRATKERRDKAAREALAAGLTNANSLGAMPEQLPDIAPASELQPDVLVSMPMPMLDLPVDNDASFKLDSDLDLPEGDFDPTTIDPALAALSAAIPGTLAELEVKKEGKRKVDGADGLTEIGVGEEKRPRLDDVANGLV